MQDAIYKRKRKSLKAFHDTGQINGMRNVLWFQQILRFWNDCGKFCSEESSSWPLGMGRIWFG